MDIVVDANILFAVMIKKGITERILLSNDLHLYAPEYIFVEFRKHEKDILEITGRTSADFLKLVELLERRIELVPVLEFKHYMKEADSLLEDKDDAAYLAVCLAKALPLWSNDNGFRKQNRVKVYTTQELIAILKLD
ncbi:MAG: PIN domain-containing protein [Candidatus Micrarchaeia archaeon]